MPTVTGKYDVMVIGGTSMDTIIHLDQLPEPVPQTLWARYYWLAVGSTGAGKALNLAALGRTTILHSALGRDDEANRIKEALHVAGVSLMVAESSEPTEQHVNLMTAAGERLSIFVRPPPTPQALDWSLIADRAADCRLLVVNIIEYVGQGLRSLQQAKVPLWTDLHDYDGKNPYHQPFINAADVIFLSSEKLPQYREWMEQQLSSGKSCLVCTHGKDGASLLGRETGWIEQPAFGSVDVVDTNGAGDAFFSGFAAAYLEGRNAQECLQLGSAVAAFCIASRQLAAPDAGTYLRTLLTAEDIQSAFNQQFKAWQVMSSADSRH